MGDFLPKLSVQDKRGIPVMCNWNQEMRTDGARLALPAFSSWQLKEGMLLAALECVPSNVVMWSTVSGQTARTTYCAEPVSVVGASLMLSI